MKKDDKPSASFVSAILRAYDKAKAEDGEVTCSAIWTLSGMDAFCTPGAFVALFEWDTSKAKKKNRIHTVAECIRRGYVPGLIVGDRLEVIDG